MKYKFILAFIVLFLICGLSTSIYILNNKIINIKSELEISLINNKAYENERDSLREENIQFQFTVDQLNNSCDSLVKKLNQVRKQLKVKDKNIKELEYIVSQNKKVDSIYVHDTLFRENIILDTLIKDEWTSLKLHLEYPNKIITDYSFKNESIIISSTEKQTISSPKRCWISRIFQKKHTIIKVNVIQKNPYCENKEQKHIKIIE